MNTPYCKQDKNNLQNDSKKNGDGGEMVEGAKYAN